MKQRVKESGEEPDKRERYFLEEVIPASRNQRNFHAASVEILYHLFYTYDILSAHLARELSSYNLSLSALNVLLVLSRRADGAPLHELSELLLVSRANVTGLVDCLEKRGLVARINDPGDRRIRYAKLTVAGTSLLERLMPQHYVTLRRAAAGIDDAQKKQLVELLTEFRKGILALDAEAVAKKEK